jgi:sigma-54 specific flagellar transcriptional regulator A
MDLVTTGENLPAVAPDLVVGGVSGGRWRIRQMSSPLVESLGCEFDELQGRDVRSVFDEATPSLIDLAEEVLSTERPMLDVPVRLHQSAQLMMAEVVPGGLAGDYREHLVSFSFRAAQVDVEQDGHSVLRFGLVGSSPGMLAVYRKIELYAESDATVLVTGETGTGKELVARALHQQSNRHSRPFVAVNCSAISAELLESELFGHEKGAFTGALREHKGRFERADGGTIFLDEIGDMPLRAQAKLLRVLETGRVERVGAEREVAVDVRVVGATNVSLESAVAAGRFRADLYHRLAVLRVQLPPLRKRIEDLPFLVDYFLQQFRSQYGRSIKRLTPDAMTLLSSYLWPGNVRELRNVLERVFVETQAEVVGVRAFTEWVSERQDFSPGEWGVRNEFPVERSAVIASYEPERESQPFRESTPSSKNKQAPGYRSTTRPRNLTAETIRLACRQTGGNLAAAARLLGVHRATLYRYIAKHDLDKETLS